MQLHLHVKLDASASNGHYASACRHWIRPVSARLLGGSALLLGVPALLSGVLRLLFACRLTQKGQVSDSLMQVHGCTIANSMGAKPRWPASASETLNR